MMRTLRLGALCAALGSLLSACHPDAGQKAAEAPAASSAPEIAWEPQDTRWDWLGFEQVKPGRPLPPRPVPGRVSPLESAEWAIQAPLEGRVEQVFVRVGQRVGRGAPLLRIHSTALADLQREQALARQMVALRTQAARHAEAMQEAHAIAEQDVLIARQNLQEAQLDARTIANKLATLQLRPLSDTSYEVLAPQDGVVTRARATLGQEAGPGTDPLLTLAKLDRVVVWAQVLEADLKDLRVGDKATILATDGSTRQAAARVDSINQAIDPELHTVGVRLLTAAPAAWLLPNGFVQVLFERRGGRAIVLPAEAIVTDDLRSIVFVKGPDGRVRPREVEPTYQSDGRVEIAGGLSPGETVVVKGAILLLNEVSQ